MTRKIAIVGSSETWPQAPFNDDSWEIWTLNDMCLLAPRMDRLFEIHDEEVLLRDAKTTPSVAREIDWIKSNTTVPVYMIQCAEWAPQATQYPLDAVSKEFGEYFTSSVAYMIALALYEGTDELGIWGVDMAHATEYVTQKACCEYFIGIAKGRGIDIYLPDGCSLLLCRKRYGVEDKFTADMDRKIANLTSTMHLESARAKEAFLNEARCEAAIDMLRHLKATYGEF